MVLPLPFVSSSRHWEGSKTPKATLPAAVDPYNNATPSGQPKCQTMWVVHAEVAKEHEGIAVNLIHKALQSTAFQIS